MATNPTAWNNDPALKAEVMDRLRQHRKNTEIIQGIYRIVDEDAPSGFRGCALRCALPNDWDGDRDEGIGILDSLESYGIPLGVLFTIEMLFETIPESEAADFAVNVYDVIQVGADLHELDRLGRTCHYEDLENTVEAFLADLRACEPA
jgi:hypothetical protein